MTKSNQVDGAAAPLVAQVALRDGVRMDYRSHAGRLWSRMVDGPFVYSYPQGIKNRELLLIDGEDWHESLGPVIVEGSETINWVETGIVYEGFGRTSRNGFMVSLLGDLAGGVDVAATMFREVVLVHSRDGYDVATPIMHRNVANLAEMICLTLHDMRLSQLEPEEMRALAVLGRKKDKFDVDEVIDAFGTIAPLIEEMSAVYLKNAFRPERLRWMPSIQVGMHRYQRNLDFMLDRMQVVREYHGRGASSAVELADLSI